MKFPEKYRVQTPVPGLDAFQFKHRGMIIFCLASIDGEICEYASVTVRYPNQKPKRCPTWDEMCLVKGLLWDAEEEVIQFYPKKSNYANAHPFCRHLWRPVNGDLNLPGFNG